MCESKVYLTDKTGVPHQVMDNVTHIQQEDGVYLLVNLLGEQKLIRGQITGIDLLHHTVYLECTRDPFAPTT